MNIGENIKIIRTSKGLTQKELAEKLGKTPQYVSKIENNISSPNVKTIDKIAMALNVPIEDITGKTPKLDQSKDFGEKYAHFIDKNLTNDEMALLFFYRTLSPSEKNTAFIQIMNISRGLPTSSYFDSESSLPGDETDPDEQ